MMPSPALRLRGASLTLVLLFSSAPLVAAAQAPAGRWLLLPVHTGEKRDAASASSSIGALETELRGAKQTLLANQSAVALFEKQHSADPVALSNDELKRLSRRIGQAARHLALGDLDEAQQAMADIAALSDPARDFLSRDAARARKLFDNCSMAAYVLERNGEHRAALQQMLECSRNFPSARPEGRAYPAQMRRLFEEATLQLNQKGTATLRVLSVGRNGCTVRLNGREVGKSPLQLDELRAGPVRVQLECDTGTVGRIHSLDLAPGKNELSVDPQFDAALNTNGGLWLAYPNEVERDTRAPHDARIVGEVLDAQRVVMLWTLPGALGSDVAVRPIGFGAPRELARASHAADTGYARGGASKLVSALLGWAQAQPSAATKAQAARPSGDRSGRPSAKPAAAPPALPPPPPPPPPPASVAAARGPERYTQQHAAAGAMLAVIGGAGTAVSWVVYAERQGKRTVISGMRDETSFRKLGVVAISTAGLGASLLSLSEYFWLPDERAIPPYAWVVGGIGLALAATAVTLSLTEATCRLGDDRVGCQNFWADHFFGPMLLIQSLPLLTTPLSYGLRVVFRPPNVQIALSAEPDGMPTLRVWGRF